MIKNIISVCVLLASSCSFNEQKLENRSPAQESPTTNPIKKLTFDELVKNISLSKASSVSEALKSLRKDYELYMHFHTLMYSSLSLQESSFEEPRAIVFGPDADFIFAFNGGPHQRAGNTIETMEFDYKTSEFKFREITFLKELSELKEQAIDKNEIAFENSVIRYSKPNPKKCSLCHDQKSQPIWETYFIWPGAFGSNDDILTSLFYKSGFNPNYDFVLRDGANVGSSQGRFITLKKGVKDVESSGFARFIARKSIHSRYKFLPDRGIDSAFNKLNAGEIASTIDSSSEIQAESLLLNTNAYSFPRPNDFLSTKLYLLSIKNLVAHLFRSKTGMQLSYKLAWIYECATYDETKNINSNLSEFEAKDPLVLFKALISAAEIQDIRLKAGSWRKYFQEYLKRELKMEAKKVERMEKTFGKDSLEVSKSYSNENSEERGRSMTYYRLLLGRPLSRFEEIVAHDESENFYVEATISYIAEGSGVNLGKFATNLERVPTFRERGLGGLSKEILIRENKMPPEEPYGDPQAAMAKICKQLKSQITQN